MEDQPKSSFNVWDYKPWWCQPWSIILTGLTLISLSWLLLHRVWLTGLVALPISVWMIYFVGIYPKIISQLEAADELIEPPAN